MDRFTTPQNTALLILRITTAIVFLYAGIVKWGMWSIDPAAMGMPEWLFLFMKILSFAEPIGGVALIVGFLTRYAAVGLSVIMVGAIFVTQFTMHIGFATATGAGWNLPFAVLGGVVTLIAFGGGAWSVDALMRRQSSPLQAA